MAKKFSLLGCVALMIASIHSRRTASASSFSGMLLESSQVPTSRLEPMTSRSDL